MSDSKAHTSLIVSRDVIPSEKHEFEKNLKALNRAIENFPGYLGTNVFYPEGDNTEYQIQVRFETESQFNKWLNSDERKKWVDKLDAHSKHQPKMRIISGLETWFALPKISSLVPPARYKMAIVTWLALTPTLIVYKYIVDPFMSNYSMVSQVILTTVVMVSVMTYGIMPLMTKLFKRWLY